MVPIAAGPKPASCDRSIVQMLGSNFDNSNNLVRRGRINTRRKRWQVQGMLDGLSSSQPAQIGARHLVLYVAAHHKSLRRSSAAAEQVEAVILPADTRQAEGGLNCHASHRACCYCLPHVDAGSLRQRAFSSLSRHIAVELCDAGDANGRAMCRRAPGVPGEIVALPLLR